MGLEGVIIGLVVIIVIYLVVGAGGGYACRDADQWIQTTQTPWDKGWFKGGGTPEKLVKYSLNKWSTTGNPSSVCKIFNNGSPYNPLKWINPYSYCNEQRLATCQQRDDGTCNIDWQTPDNSWCKPEAWYSEKSCEGEISTTSPIVIPAEKDGVCYGSEGDDCETKADATGCTPPCMWFTQDTLDTITNCQSIGDENVCDIIPGCSLKEASTS